MPASFLFITHFTLNLDIILDIFHHLEIWTHCISENGFVFTIRCEER